MKQENKLKEKIKSFDLPIPFTFRLNENNNNQNENLRQVHHQQFQSEIKPKNINFFNNSNNDLNIMKAKNCLSSKNANVNNSNFGNLVGNNFFSSQNIINQTITPQKNDNRDKSLISSN